MILVPLEKFYDTLSPLLENKQESNLDKILMHVLADKSALILLQFED